MWILEWLPFWIFHLVTLAGVAGLIAAQFFSFIPFVSQYKLPLQVVAIAALVFGVYMEGGVANQERWEAKVKEMQVKVAQAAAKVKEMQVKVAQAEAQSQKENIKIVEKIVTKTEYYHTKGDDVVKYIDREIVKYDDQCKIPTEFVQALNNAASKE